MPTRLAPTRNAVTLVGLVLETMGLHVYPSSMILTIGEIYSTMMNHFTDRLSSGAVGKKCPSIINGKAVCYGTTCAIECLSGYLQNGKCPIAASQAPKKRKLNKDVSLCPTGETACPIAGAASFSFSTHHNVTALRTTDLVKGSDGYECLDTKTSLESCGGCSSAGQGEDCSKLPNTVGVGVRVLSLFLTCNV